MAATDWRRSVLQRIGAPVTPQNLKFLAGWQRWEGGHTKNDARFNWLNTTRGPGRAINSVGVRAFDNYQTGIRYTAETLLNGRYDDIVGGLRGGNPYSHDLTSGLSTWVSGSPTGGLGYAQKVMGRGGAPKAALPAGGRGPKGNPGLAPSLSMPDYPDEFLYDIWGDMAPLYKRVFGSKKQVVPTGGGIIAQTESKPHRANGKRLLMPTTPHGTHVSDGLGWDTKTAEDIMASPGTAVQAPAGGQVVYWHPTGAQGGGSMLIRLDNGREYWLGHVANGMKAGTRFKRGATLALISSDHANPHLHVDKR